MIGAIIGDIVGSRFEFNNLKSKDFELFKQGCFTTDDSMMSLAVAASLLDQGQCTLEEKACYWMRKLGSRYPDKGYGGFFSQWLRNPNMGPYNSFGNGSAMRISAVGFACASLENGFELSDKITGITHNHPQALLGARATVGLIYLARTKATKVDMRNFIEDRFYHLDFTLDQIRPTYVFNETCMDTVPQAIEAFLESNSFEDSIRNAISLGGDSDTLACITGAIAQAYYNVPHSIRAKAETYLDSYQKTILKDFERTFMQEEL